VVSVSIKDREGGVAGNIDSVVGTGCEPVELFQAYFYIFELFIKKRFRFIEFCGINCSCATFDFNDFTLNGTWGIRNQPIAWGGEEQ
jgi:hypothetical protein